MKSPTATDRKVDVMVSLIRFFEAGGMTTAAQLAADKGVTHRTANRWIEDVQRWVALEHARNGTYRGCYRKAVLLESIPLERDR